MVDYYELLGVGKSADASEIRRGYREQALRHHPDKNTERVGEATERFKLIAEAYSVLQNPQARADYDFHGHSNPKRRGSTTTFTSTSTTASSFRSEEPSDNTRSSFSAETARDLFQEVFGEEVVAKLSRAVAPVVDAADRVGKTSLVRGAVAGGLKSLMEEVECAAVSKRREEAHSKSCWQERLQELNDHTSRCSAIQNARRERRDTFWEKLKWGKRQRRRADEDAFDRESAITSARLRQEVYAAKMSLTESRKELAEAEASVKHARSELEEVKHGDGASFGRAATAGVHFFRRLLADSILY